MASAENMKKTAIHFGMLEAIYWSIMASFGSYIASFCLYRGYEQSLISRLIAVYMSCAFAGQFFWGSMCDKLRTNKKIFLGLVVAAGTIQLGMFFVHGKLGFAILYGLFGFTIGPIGSILDTWMLRTFRYDMKLYGAPRGAGSAGYAIVILLTGRLIKMFGYHVMPIISTFFVLMTMVVASKAKDVEIGALDKREAINLKNILSIIRIPSYLLILSVVFFVGMANQPVNSLKIVLLQEVGGNVATQGLDAFIGCMVQFLFFAVSGYITFISAGYRLFIAATAMVLAMVVNFCAGSVWMVIIGTMLMNVTFSLLIAASRELVFHIVEPKYQTTANGLSDASYMYIAGTISMLYAGSVAQNSGIYFMIGISLLMSVIAFVIMCVNLFVNHRK